MEIVSGKLKFKPYMPGPNNFERIITSVWCEKIFFCDENINMKARKAKKRAFQKGLLEGKPCLCDEVV